MKLTVWDQKKDGFPTGLIETPQSGKNGEFGINTGEEKPETKLVMGVEKNEFKLVVMQFTPSLVQKNNAKYSKIIRSC